MFKLTVPESLKESGEKSKFTITGLKVKIILGWKNKVDRIMFAKNICGVF
jgi:hypothetical protein